MNTDATKSSTNRLALMALFSVLCVIVGGLIVLARQKPTAPEESATNAQEDSPEATEEKVEEEVPQAESSEEAAEETEEKTE